MKKGVFNHILALWMIITISVVLGYFADEKGKNAILIYTMYLSPFLLLSKIVSIDKSDWFLIASLVMMYLTTILFHPQSLKINTLLYSTLFVCYYLLYKNLCLRNAISIASYINVIKYIIYAYAIVLIIQQIQVLLNIHPVLNYYNEINDGLKLKSLSLEPAHTLMILPIIMFSYIKNVVILRNKTQYTFSDVIKEDALIWLAFLYVCLTCKSMTMFISLPLFFIYFFKSHFLRILPLLVLFGYIVVRLISTYNYDMLERFTSLLSVESILDGSIDSSSRSRFLPVIVYFETINMSDINFWIGSGLDALASTYTQILGEDRLNIGNGSILSLFYDYGFVTGALFLIFISKSVLPKLFSYETLFCISFILFLSFNTYILWLLIMTMYSNVYFENRAAKIK